MTAAAEPHRRRSKRRQIGSWGTEALEVSFERDAKRRATRPERPSDSRAPRRCSTCHEWGFATADGHCRWCLDLYIPAPLVGLARVLDADLHRHR